MAQKLTLDAMIKRADFFQMNNEENLNGDTTALIAIRSEKRTERMSAVFEYLVNELVENKSPTLSGLSDAANLKSTLVQIREKVSGKKFSEEGKSTIFLRTALKNAIKCPVCSGYL